MTIAAVCLILWLTQWVPVWVPTLVLWIATPAVLWSIDDRFSPINVVSWSIDPVLALFLGGFALAASARYHGVDSKLAAMALRTAGHSPVRLLSAAAFATALLSMWMSNVAAAALMLNAFRPIWNSETRDSALRRSLLLAIALAADVGGIATPIGTGANGIALAAVEHVRKISFVHWMAFGVPLASGLVTVCVAVVVLRLRPKAPAPTSVTDSTPDDSQFADEAAREHVQSAPPRSSRTLGFVFGITIALWLSEPLHGIPAWIVALVAVVALLVSRALPFRDLRTLNWGTLLLVAGGIGLGALLDRTGVVRDAALRLPVHEFPEFTRMFILCVVSASLASLMSNTGTAALLIPLATTIDPSPSTAILIAVAASLGIPFVISTPPNAMAASGGLKSTDLLIPGLVVMLGGCLLIALTGKWVLGLVGV